MNAIEMKRGQKAVVCDIQNEKGIDRKMFEIGIRQGTEIELLEKHPFKGPVLFKVGSGRIVLGREMAANLQVNLLG